jgi:hypothetical protein
MDQNQQLLA